MINRGRIGFQEGGNPRFAGDYRPEQISFDDWFRGKISGGSDKYGYLKNISKKYGYNLADALDLLYKYEIEHPKNLAEDPNYSINRLDGEDFYKMQFKTLEESGAAAQQNPEQEKYMLEQGYDAILKNYGLLDSTSKFPTIDPFTGKPYGIDPNAPVQPVGPAPPDNYYDEVPTIDPFSGQPISAQDLIDINKEMSAKAPPGGFSEEGLRKNADDDAGRLQSMMEAFNSGFYNNTPTVDPFSGQQVSAQDQLAFRQPQDIFPQQESTGLNYLMGMPDSDSSSVSNLGRQDILNLLTSNFNNLDLQTMNEIRNNPGSFTVENPYLQAARTGIQSLSPGKVMSDVGEGLSTIYHGTADPSKAFSGSKFFATPDYQTALQYAKEGALRGTSIGNATGDVLRATAPTSQIQDLLKRGLTGTREIVLDPQAAQKLFLQGSGNLVETGSLASRLGRKAFQALPAVGAGIAGLDAYQRFNQGDYIGAGLGAASAIPGIGLPATAAQILYDVVYKPNQRN
jgi:hypothetical protein